MPKRRLDELLVERGLAPTRQRARALVMAGRVHGPNRRYTTPGQAVPAETELAVAAAAAFVSRGGLKLRAALEAWAIDPRDAVCLDLGASTGGFTDCLLQGGASRVYAVDVGYGLLAEPLRRDPRVVVVERTNARGLAEQASRFEPRPSLVTIDVAFISLRAVLPAAAAVSAPGSDLLALVKPQFEAAREAVDRSGVVRAPADRAAAVRGVAIWAWERGWRLGGVLRSPLSGRAGNEEFWLWLRGPTPAGESGR